MTAITEYHKEFALAVVVLARQHNMDKIKLEFESDFNHPSGHVFGERVTMSWCAGRHGDLNKIHLECRATEYINEINIFKKEN